MNVKIYKNILLDILAFIVDIAAVLVSGLAADKIISLFLRGSGISYEYKIIALIMYCIGLMIMFYFYEIYTTVIRSRYEMMLSVGISVLVAAAGTCIAGAFLKNTDHTLLCLYALLSSVILAPVMYLLKRGYVRLMKRLEGCVKLLVLESNQIPNNFARKIKYSALSVYESWYIIVDVENMDEINKIMDEQFPQYNCLFISPTIPSRIKDIFISRAVSLGMEIYMIPDLYNTSIMKSTLMQFDDTPALKIQTYGLTKIQRAIKRAFDVVVSLIGIILTSPIMLICAAAVKIDSGGSVFYRQERLTIYQKPFYVWKFRTMIQNAEAVTGAVLAEENDPRITRVGRILRAARLDELPQLFNVLSGSMSLVGPRPERPVFVSRFLKEIPNYDKRYFVKAGLTGMAQVYANYDTKPGDKLLFDMLYIRGYSFSLDIKLILLTIKIVLTREKSKGVSSEPDYANKTGTKMKNGADIPPKKNGDSKERGVDYERK